MFNRKISRTDSDCNRELILRKLQKSSKTSNEVIESIWKDDLRTGKVHSRNWRFYVHLNKLFAKLSRDGHIEELDNTKKGPTGRNEKIWRIKNV